MVWVGNAAPNVLNNSEEADIYSELKTLVDMKNIIW